VLPGKRPEPRRLDRQQPLVAFGVAPDVEHVDGPTITLRDAEPRRHRNAVADAELRHRTRGRFAVFALDEYRVVSGDPDGAAVAGRDLVAGTAWRMGEQRSRFRCDDRGVLAESRNREPLERIFGGIEKRGSR